MPSHKLIQIVASESTPEKEAKFNKWYTEVHVPMFFEYKGLKQVTRYQLKGEDKNCAKFLSIYEFDTEEALADFPKSQAFAKAVVDFEDKKETVGFTPRWAGVYERIKTWER